MKLGILGGGQLGRMMALAAAPLGVRCTVLDPSPEPCAAQVCDHIAGEFEDHQALYKLVQVSDAITYEFENVPVATARWLAERVPVYPPPRALEVSQDRVVEKEFLAGKGVPTPPFAAIETETDFRNAVAKVGLPSVVKTRRFGYDGKGQMVLKTAADAAHAWETLGGRDLILEGFIPFTRELSILAVRGRTGETLFYPLCENTHSEGMLRLTLAPAANSEALFEQAAAHATRVLNALEYVGVLAIEFFEHDGKLIANEMAPRVHNSGHWTQDGAVTSQFENHVRAVLGLPLGSTRSLGHCAMINLISDHPPFEKILTHPDAKLHWYGKSPRPRRKIGHVNVCCENDSTRHHILRELESLS